jgi:hypothetical protein|tara:strand:- start:23303 stop:23494 length:192 start_codon:yes stop_codon:yes gene_type:complete
MKNLPAYEKERINQVNFLMNQIHMSSASIYESLIDRDFEDLEQELNSLIFILKDVLASIENDI